MKKNKEEKELYLAPAVEVVKLASPISLLETFSGTGSVEELIDGNLDDAGWGIDGSGEPEDWFN